MKSYKDCPFHPQLMMGEIMKEYCGARILTDTHGLDIQNMRCLQDACILVQQQKEIEEIKSSHINMWGAHNKLWESEKKYEGEVKRGLENQIERLEKEIEKLSKQVAAFSDAADKDYEDVIGRVEKLEEVNCPKEEEE